MAIDLGDTVRLVYEHRAAVGNRAAPAEITLTIGLPDGTDTEITPADPDTPGVYEHEYVTTQVGRHTVRWVGTDPWGAFVDVFDVRPATPLYLVSLAEARHRLRLGTDDDEELRSVVEAVTAPVEDIVGVVVAREFADVLPGGGKLIVDHPPLLELLEVTPAHTGGVSYDVDDLGVDEAPGVVWRLDGGVFAGSLRVRYLAGRRVIDAAILEAAEIIVDHLWETRRGHSGGARPGFGEDDLVHTPSGFLIPRRAEELLAPFRIRVNAP